MEKLEEVNQSLKDQRISVIAKRQSNEKGAKRRQGVYLSTDLSFNLQVEKTVTSASKIAFMIIFL